MEERRHIMQSPQLDKIEGMLNAQAEKADGRHNVILEKIGNIEQNIQKFDKELIKCEVRDTEQNIRLRALESNLGMCQTGHNVADEIKKHSNSMLLSKIAITFAGCAVLWDILKSFFKIKG